jgi:hypothetical protein
MMANYVNLLMQFILIIFNQIKFMNYLSIHKTRKFLQKDWDVELHLTIRTKSIFLVVRHIKKG